MWQLETASTIDCAERSILRQLTTHWCAILFVYSARHCTGWPQGKLGRLALTQCSFTRQICHYPLIRNVQRINELHQRYPRNLLPLCLTVRQNLSALMPLLSSERLRWYYMWKRCFGAARAHLIHIYMNVSAGLTTNDNKEKKMSETQGFIVLYLYLKRVPNQSAWEQSHVMETPLRGITLASGIAHLHIDDVRTSKASYTKALFE